MKNYSIKTVQQVGQFGVGLGLAAGFVLTMDDMIYQNFRKNVFLPMQMARITGKGDTPSTLQQLSGTIKGTGQFFYDMRPMGLDTQNSARELLLKDADYSTPQDHYFAHLNRLKGGDADRREDFEELVLQGIGTDSQILNYVIQQNQKQQDKPFLQDFENLPEKTRYELAIKYGFDPIKDHDRLRNIFAGLDGDWIDKGKAKIKRDKEILDNIDLSALIGVRKDNRKKVKYEDQFNQDEAETSEQMMKLKQKPVVKKEDGKKLSRTERMQRRKAREQELTDVLQQAEMSGGPIDPDQAVKAVEQSRYEASEMTKRDVNRLQRLKRKAEEGATSIVSEGDFQ